MENKASLVEGGIAGDPEAGDKEIVSRSSETVEVAVAEEQLGNDYAGKPQQVDDEESLDLSVEDYLDVSIHDENAVARRVEWRNGSVCADTRAVEGDAQGGTIWGTLVGVFLQEKPDERYESGFRKLFSIESTDAEDNIGIENLLGLFGDDSPSLPTSPANRSIGTPSPSTVRLSQPDMPVLTQRGKKLAEDIESKLSADSICLAKVASVCPQWKENVAFAMQQQDPADIHVALDQIRQSKERLHRMKDGFMKALEKHHAVLDVFEDSLTQSLGRLLNNVTPPMLVAEADDESMVEQ